MNHLLAQGLSRSFQHNEIINSINLTIERGKIYSIIGPNGCGKSTLIRMLARQLKPSVGEVFLNGSELYKLSIRKAAKEMALLSQQSDLVDITVEQLVSYGRTPHKSFLKKLDSEDLAIINQAIEQTNLAHLSNRNVSTLSGGERQRVWIALAIAQQPSILFLDEPTTYLDVSHQLEVLRVVENLNQNYGVTIVMVLHDLNHAAQYSDEIFVMNKGEIQLSGTPGDVMTSTMFEDVFAVRANVLIDPEDGSSIYSLKRIGEMKVGN